MKTRLTIFLARISYALPWRDREDRRATGQPQGVGPEAYLNGTSQGPTSEDARKDGYLRCRSRPYMKHPGFTVLIAVLIFGTTPVALAGKLQQQLIDESTIEQVLKRGVLRVGMSTFVPWALKDKTGRFVGFEIDVATRLAKDTGVRVEFVPTKWEGIIPALLTGKFDVIIGGMTIRPDRNLKVNFSIPYDYSGQTICAHKVLAAGLKSPEDFNRPDVTLGARLGSTSVPAIKRIMPKATLRLFPDEGQLYQELLNGNLHAVVASLPTPAYQALKYPETLFAITEPFSRELIGFALRKGDSDTLNYFNNWVRSVEAEGWLQERHNYWFNTKDWEGLIK